MLAVGVMLYRPFFSWQAVGVMLFLLLSGTKPFSGEGIKEHFDEIEASEKILKLHFRSPEWQSVSEAARDLVGKLLHANANVRPSAEEVISP